jgi:hypothetical protein
VTNTARVKAIRLSILTTTVLDHTPRTGTFLATTLSARSTPCSLQHQRQQHSIQRQRRQRSLQHQHQLRSIQRQRQQRSLRHQRQLRSIQRQRQQRSLRRMHLRAPLRHSPQRETPARATSPCTSTGLKALPRVSLASRRLNWRGAAISQLVHQWYCPGLGTNPWGCSAT